MGFEADVAYVDRFIDTIVLEDVDDIDQAEFEAMNKIRDLNPGCSEVEVLEVREIV